MLFKIAVVGFLTLIDVRVGLVVSGGSIVAYFLISFAILSPRASGNRKYRLGLLVQGHFVLVD